MSFRRTTMRALAAALILCGGALFEHANAESYDIRFAEIGSPRGPRAEALQWWADELQRRTDGQVKVEIFWSGSLVSAKEVLQAVGTGLADGGTIVGAYTPAETPVWAVASTPFLFDDPWVGMRAVFGARETIPELEAETIKANVKILANNTTGSMQLVSKKPLIEVEDLEGMKLRGGGGWSKLFNELGAVSVSVSGAEAYQALDRGTIDGSMYSIPLIKSYKLHEVAGHVTLADMGQSLAYGIGINLDMWNSMSPEMQAIVARTSLDYMDRFAQLYAEDEQKSREDMEAGVDGHKVVFHELNDAQKAEWAAPAQLLLDEWIKTVGERGLDGEAILEKLYEIRDQYRAEVAARGYPWTR